MHGAFAASSIFCLGTVDTIRTNACQSQAEILGPRSPTPPAPFQMRPHLWQPWFAVFVETRRPAFTFSRLGVLCKKCRESMLSGQHIDASPP
jgi:hypothetical protein